MKCVLWAKTIQHPVSVASGVIATNDLRVLRTNLPSGVGMLMSDLCLTARSGGLLGGGSGTNSDGPGLKRASLGSAAALRDLSAPAFQYRRTQCARALRSVGQGQLFDPELRSRQHSADLDSGIGKFKDTAYGLPSEALPRSLQQS